MSSKEKIIDQLKNAIIQKDEIIFSYIHGSFLDKFPFQDIDIALYIDSKKISSLQVFDYSFQLSVDLSKKIGLEVDIQIMNYAPLGFKHSVLRNGKLLFSKDENLRLNLIESLSLEYIDFYELSLQYIHDIVY
ncbi:MAG: nucleotidyltransferase domain-containing protein [Acidobacteriota bacterium]|nr:nucleotidyltransferase domain-containing protein [Acidobacteriota bacterium]